MRLVVPPRSNRLGGSLMLAVTLVASACTAAAPGWTFPPARGARTTSQPGASTGPAASGGLAARARAAAPARVRPRGRPSGGLPPRAVSGGGTGGAVSNVKAENIAFDVTSLTAPANAPFQIKFENDDAGTQHDVAIKDSSGALKWQGDLVTGIAETTYNVPALPAGSYTFVCIVHPTMTGTLDIH